MTSFIETIGVTFIGTFIGTLVIGSAILHGCELGEPWRGEAEAVRVQNEENEPGCSFPGPVTALHCSEAFCLVCHSVGDGAASVCTAIRVDRCR